MVRKNIGVLIHHTTTTGGFHNAIFRAVVECFTEFPDLNLFILNGGHLDSSDNEYAVHIGYAETYNKLYELVKTSFLDGLIILYTIGNFINQDEFCAFCKNLGKFPMITILGSLPGIPSVSLNNKTGFCELLYHLCDNLHYKKIAYIKGIMGNPDSIERFEIFNNVMLEKQIISRPYEINEKHPLLFDGNFSEADGRDAVDYFLPLIRKREIDVIVAANDEMAKGAINELRKKGIAVPGEIAVTGFDNAPGAVAIIPSLTSVDPSYKQIFQKAVEWLVARFQAGTEELRENNEQRFFVDSKMILRQSCGSLSLNKNREGSELPYETSPGGLLPEEDFRLLSRAFLKTVENSQDNAFYIQIRQLIYRDVIEGKAIAPWNEYITQVLAYMKKEYDVSPQIIEQITVNSSVLLDRILHEIFLDHDTRMNDRLSDILKILARISSCFDYEKFQEVILKHMHELQINSLYIYLYRKNENSATSFNLHFAYKDRNVLDITKLEKQKPDTINLGVLPEERPWRYCIHGLQYDWKPLGFLLIEIDSHNIDGILYTNLQEVIRTAMKGYLLIKQEINALDIINNFHRKLLPEISNSCFGEYAVSAISLPIATGGGDLFNIYYKDNRLKVAIGDVSSHGVLAGMVMMLNLMSYQLMVKEEGITDSKVFLEKLNSRLYDIIANNLELSNYTTFMLFQQLGAHEFEYAGQHNPPLIYHAAGRHCTSLKTKGIWLGLINKEEFKDTIQTNTLIMEPGDILILYTDGITEVINRTGDMFGEKGIKKTVEKYMTTTPEKKVDIKKLRDSIISAVRMWGEPDDDMTLVIMRHL